MKKVIIREATYEGLAPIIKEIFETFPVNVSNKRVFIKPNLVRAEHPDKAVTTHPEILRIIAEEVARRGGEPWIGENGVVINNLYTMTGLADTCAPYIKNISREAVLAEIGGYSVPISKAFVEADVFINVPKLKTHVIAGITCCMKNTFGLIPANFKARMHALTGHAKMLTEFIIDLYRWRSPDLNIVDGILAMEGDGPSFGTPRKVGKVIAGDDGVAVDSVCARMIGFANPRHIKMIDLAHRKGLKVTDFHEIAVDGPFEVIEDFFHPSTYTAHITGKKSPFAATAEEAYQIWGELGRITPSCDDALCTQCQDCLKICPTDAITLEPFPRIDPERCLSCFCCVEGCEEGALNIVLSEEIQEKRRRVGM